MMNLDTSDLRIRTVPKKMTAAFLRRLQKAADRRMEKLRRAGKIRKQSKADV